MATRSKIITDFQSSGRTHDAAVDAVARWLSAGYPQDELLKYVGGISAVALLQGQQAAVSADYIH